MKAHIRLVLRSRNREYMPPVPLWRLYDVGVRWKDTCTFYHLNFKSIDIITKSTFRSPLTFFLCFHLKNCFSPNIYNHEESVSQYSVWLRTGPPGY
jgi:hypothetical protein